MAADEEREPRHPRYAMVSLVAQLAYEEFVPKEESHV